MAKKHKKNLLAPIMVCTLALIVVIMLLLPAFTTRENLFGTTTSSNIFEMIGDVFNGNSSSTWFSIDVLLYFTAFIMSILVIVFALAYLFANKKAIMKILNILGFIIGILGLLALIFAFVAVSDYNGSVIAFTMSVNIWPILASALCIILPICNYITNK